MNEEQIEELLIDATHEFDELTGDEGIRVRTYEEAGVLTNDRGFVVTMGDRSEYQITIIRSR